MLIEAAVRLISEKGADALSVAALARTVGINRTTVYYHFESRDALLADVKAWSSEQLARAFAPDAPQADCIDYIARFVLEHPELIKLWIEDFVSPGDIRTSYPQWDRLVKGINARMAALRPEDQIDAEVYCVILLAGAFLGPRIFHNSVRPDHDIATVVQRFRKEQQRMLKRDALLDA